MGDLFAKYNKEERFDGSFEMLWFNQLGHNDDGS